MSFEQLFAELNRNTTKMANTLDQIKRDTDATRKTSDKQLEATKAAENEKRRDKADSQKADNPDQKIIKLLEELNEKLDNQGDDKDNPLSNIAGGLGNGLATGAGILGAGGIAALGKSIGAAIVSAVPALAAGSALVGAPLGLAAGFGTMYEHVRKNSVYGGEEAGDYGFELDKKVMELTQKNNSRQGGNGVRHRGGARTGNPVNLSESDKKKLEVLRDLQKQITESREKRDQAIREASSAPDRRGRRRGPSPEVKARLEAEHQERVRAIQEANPLNELQTGGYVWKSPVQMFQQGGGVFKVPGNSTGDNHNMMVPTGSFVLNRNASRALSSASGFQNGGLVPIKTESQEMIFGPGAWSGLIPALNSMIPRFQSGGVVQASHPDTGSGFQPAGAVDAHGRPVVLNKEGAEAFARAIAESGGLVKGSDVASSKRSQAKNASLSGAHPNSTHLYGEGLDASGPTAAWLRKNQHLGWKEGYSHGGSSWHFNWKGGDSGNKDSYATDGSSGSNANTESINPLGNLNLNTGNIDSVLSSITSVLSGDNIFAKFALLGGGLGSAITAGASLFGGALSGIGKSLGLNMDGGSSASSSSGGTPQMTGGTKGLLDFISHYESGGDYNKIFGGASIDGLTDKTIREVVQIQKDHLGKGFESAAIGRYQMMLPDVYAQKAGLSLDDKFSRENQDKMAMVYLEEDGLSSYLSGNMSADKFANNVAGTWAALPMADGQSYHKGVGSNKSLVDRDTYMKAIKMVKSDVSNTGDGKNGSFGLGTHGLGMPSNTQGFQSGGNVQRVKVESGELIFPPGSYGPEIPMLNDQVFQVPEWWYDRVTKSFHL